MAPKKSFSACIFCLNSPYKNPSISLHSFPKDISKRSLWLTACGLTEEDYKPSRKLCSRHFEKDCYKTGTNLKILKPNSVPTKLNKHAIEFFKSTSSHKQPKMSSRDVPELPTYKMDNQAVSTPEFETISNCEILPPQIYNTLKQKMQKYYEDDVTTPDLVPSWKAEHNYTKTECEIIEQRKIIKYLNLKVSRLRKRLADKAKLLNHLMANRSSN